MLPPVPDFLADRYEFNSPPDKGLCVRATSQSPQVCCWRDMISVDRLGTNPRGTPVAVITVHRADRQNITGRIPLSAIKTGSTALRAALAGQCAMVLKKSTTKHLQRYLSAWVSHLQVSLPSPTLPVKVGFLSSTGAETSAPRRFSPERALRLTYQHAEIDRLSRDAGARYSRLLIALHEAHHLMGTVLYQQGCGECWIPPAHRRPMILGGARGQIHTCGADALSDYIIQMMGPICEELIQGDIDAPQGATDRQTAEALMRGSPHLRQRRDELTQLARDIAIGYAAEIDLAACAMLDMSNNEGIVTAKKMQPLYHWLVDRQEGDIAQGGLDERPLFLQALGISKLPSDALTPASRRERRVRVIDHLRPELVL